MKLALRIVISLTLINYIYAGINYVVGDYTYESRRHKILDVLPPQKYKTNALFQGVEIPDPGHTDALWFVFNMSLNSIGGSSDVVDGQRIITVSLSEDKTMAIRAISYHLLQGYVNLDEKNCLVDTVPIIETPLTQNQEKK